MNVQLLEINKVNVSISFYVVTKIDILTEICQTTHSNNIILIITMIDASEEVINKDVPK